MKQAGASKARTQGVAPLMGLRPIGHPGLAMRFTEKEAAVAKLRCNPLIPKPGSDLGKPVHPRWLQTGAVRPAQPKWALRLTVSRYCRPLGLALTGWLVTPPSLPPATRTQPTRPYNTLRPVQSGFGYDAGWPNEPVVVASLKGTAIPYAPRCQGCQEGSRSDTGCNTL